MDERADRQTNQKRRKRRRKGRVKGKGEQEKEAGWRNGLVTVFAAQASKSEFKSPTHTERAGCCGVHL